MVVDKKEEPIMNLEELKKLSDMLAALMADPHPGLSTWIIALADVLDQLRNY